MWSSPRVVQTLEAFNDWFWSTFAGICATRIHWSVHVTSRHWQQLRALPACCLRHWPLKQQRSGWSWWVLERVGLLLSEDLHLSFPRSGGCNETSKGWTAALLKNEWYKMNLKDNFEGYIVDQNSQQEPKFSKARWRESPYQFFWDCHMTHLNLQPCSAPGLACWHLGLSHHFVCRRRNCQLSIASAHQKTVICCFWSHWAFRGVGFLDAEPLNVNLFKQVWSHVSWSFHYRSLFRNVSRDLVTNDLNMRS